MSLTVHSARVVDRFHYNGDVFWDGDQTQYELNLVDGNEQDSLLFVVQRGNEFIAKEAVGRYVEGLGTTLADMRLRARRPSPDRRPQVSLSIEPGEV